MAGSLENIIDTLKWSNIIPDEGPLGIGGDYGPYIQVFIFFKQLIN